MRLRLAADAIQGGGTMFVGKAWGSSVKTLFHHARSKRGGVLMHAKVSVVDTAGGQG